MVYRPACVEDLAETLRTAGARGETLAVTGSGSKPGLGPGEAAARLDLTALGGRVEHDPGELLLTAPAAIPLAEITSLLADAGQCLAFEPLSPAAIWGQGEGTLGGTVACALSGPRRPFAGAARDHVLGLAGVTGRGEIFRAGGKVLKNVTGFDLPRLLTGSRGTLAVITELTLKVLPLPPAEATLRLPAATAAGAVRLIAEALMVDGGLTGAAWRDGMVLLRLESTARALPALVAAAQARLPSGELVEGAASRALWAAAACLPAATDAGDSLWRCALPASRAPALAALLPAGAGLTLDWGGALAWLSLPPELAEFDVHAALATAAGREGHAERLRGPAGDIPPRAPLEPGPAALSARLKALFDPAGILSPRAAPGAGA
ncbi:FAD-binding protein [Novosphingobium piscinae]|uniref:FAD-binding protein n=1 Tax=Novosphingobium piscinae TaxID=1507448 RepID=A0A7X1FZA7_9SPHN|nr:FAD-binding protein [Novosphingobium piscinae]MBC2669755.1 FAD-binding protein [Novosphingobium piscinae]